MRINLVTSAVLQLVTMLVRTLIVTRLEKVADSFTENYFGGQKK
jgi:hypothetical protein